MCSKPSCELFHEKHPWRAKELATAGSYASAASWKHKKIKGKEEGRTRDHSGLIMSF